MSSREWKEVHLSDIVDILGDGLHGTPKYDDNGEYYFINGNNLNGKIIIDDKTKKVNYDEYLKYKKILNDRTILVSINGTIGNVALYNYEKVILGKSACYFNVIKEVDKNYVMYTMISDIFKQYFQNYATGTTIKNLGLKQIREFPFLLPPFKEQRTIASTLSCLDEMVELNNRTNQVLEEIAQAIFKRWFVDFEFPNEDGEPYKSSGGEMVDSELGEIPKGWDVGSLLDIADYLNGLAMQNFRPKENEKTYPVLKIKELRQGTTDTISEMCSVNISPNYIVDNGDLIFSWSGSLLVDFWCGGRCGLNQHLFKVTSNKFDKWYYYYWTNFHLQKFIGIAKDKATTMGHIKREDLKNSKVLIMDDITYQRLNSISNPIFETIIANRIENWKLVTIRDTLLPKIMYGELRVPIEEVV